MIGVICEDSEVWAVGEFFELFKTPWEFLVPNHHYDLVIVTSRDIPEKISTKALVIYGSLQSPWDQAFGISIQRKTGQVLLDWAGLDLPVYHSVSVFQACGNPFIELKGGHDVVGLRVSDRTAVVFRVGYDLFQEVSFLLSAGQPSENSCIPALEVHIALLRECLLSAGIPFVELASVPAGYDFMVCLTHDVDFVGIRDHKFDHTMWGFLWRALVASFVDALRGKLQWSRAVKNWKAAASLPLVYLGLQEDFWLEFDRYKDVERGLGSTFFFIPFKNCPGTDIAGPAPKRRAAKYDLDDVAQQVRDLVAQGCEVGLHGIDAWRSLDRAEAEVHRVRQISGQSEVGVRMHWLYFSEASPKILEQAGVSYDSTFGYNDAVGFRAGTSQVFRLPATKDLLELPLNVQDTALFYPTRMGLAEEDALDSCRRLIQSARRFGGALTFNWHTRSLSPERLWGEFYAKLLAELLSHRVWFGTAREIVTWFRSRRALSFEDVQFQEERVRLKMKGRTQNVQHHFLLRIHHPKWKTPMDRKLDGSMGTYWEMRLGGEVGEGRPIVNVVTDLLAENASRTPDARR